MKLRYSSIVELEKRSKKSEIRRVAFHPNALLAFVVVDDEIVGADIVTGSVTTRLQVATGEVLDVICSPIEPLIAAIVNIKEELYLQIFNTEFRASRALYPLSKLFSGKKPVLHAVNPLASKVCLTQAGSKTIYTIDMHNGSHTKIECKRAILHMVCHPTKPWLVCSHDDRSIKVYNSNQGTVSHSFEISDVEDLLKEKESISGSIGKKQGAFVSLATLLHNSEVTQLSFHPSKDILLAVAPNGCSMCFDLTVGKDPALACTGVLMLLNRHMTPPSPSASQGQPNHIVQAQFHPTHPLIMTIDRDGNMAPFYFFPGRDRWALPTASVLLPAAVEMKSRYAHVPDYVKPTSENLTLSEMRCHPKANYFSFTFKRVGTPSTEEFKLAHLFDTHRHGFYSLYASTVRANFVIPQQQAMNFFANPDRDPKTGKATFLFPNECFFLADNQIMAYSPAYGDLSTAKALPPAYSSLEAGDTYLRPIKFVYSPIRDRFLVISEAVSLEKDGQVDFVCSVISKDAGMKETPFVSNARSCCFFGPDHNSFVVLNESGKTIEVIRTVPGTRNPGSKPITLPETVESIFSTPFNNGNRILLHNTTTNQLVLSAANSLSSEEPRLRTDRALMIQLSPDEHVTQVVWQRTWNSEDPDDHYGAILTNHYLRIVDSQLGVLAQHKDQGLTSCLWLGASVLFTTSTHLMFMTLSGDVHPLLSLSLPHTAVMAALCDRVLLVAARAGQTVVMTHAVGLFQPLAAGLLELAKCDPNVELNDIKPLLKAAAECYDGKRVSLNVIEDLVEAGIYDLALRMLLGSQQFLRIKYDLAWKLAIRTKHFHTAFAILQQPFVYVNDTHRHKRKYKKLAALSMQYGQFDLARKCYEMANDGPSLIYLASLTDNKHILERLLGRYKRENTVIGPNEHVVRYLHRSLSIGKSPSAPQLTSVPQPRASVSLESAPTLGAASPPSQSSASVLHRPMPTSAPPALPLSQIAQHQSEPGSLESNKSGDVPRSSSDSSSILAAGVTWGVSYLDIDDDAGASSPRTMDVPETGAAEPGVAPEAGANRDPASLGTSSSLSHSPANTGSLTETNPVEDWNDSPFDSIETLSPSSSLTSHSPLTHAASTAKPARMMPRMSSVVATDETELTRMIRGSTAESHLLNDMNMLSSDEFQRWKMEMDAKVTCEMKTLPLQRGSGDHVVGPLLISKLLADWFSRQVTYFQIPELLLTDEYKKRSKAENLEALTDKLGSTYAGPAAGTTASAGDDRIRRTNTMTQTLGPAPSIGSISSTSSPSLSISANIAPADVKAPTRSESISEAEFRRRTTSVSQPDKVTRAPTNPINVVTRAGRTNTIFGMPPGVPIPAAPDAKASARAGNEDPDLSLPPIEHLRLAIFRLEKGDYAGGLGDTNVCIQLIVAKPSSAPEVKQRNIVAAVRYKFAITIMQELKREEESPNPSPQRLSLLSLVLAYLPVLPRHRIIFVRQAVKRNTEAQNYAIVNSLISEDLMKRKLPDRLALEEKLTICREKGLKDAPDAPPLRPKICYKTFKLLPPGSHCIKCRFCDAYFADDAIAVSSFCSYCLQKVLVSHTVE